MGRFSRSKPDEVAVGQVGTAPTSLRGSSDGFTIVELMIATSVFAVVLLIITVGVLHFSNSYYKGVNASATQTATQSAVDIISQAIQFSSGGTTADTTAPATASYFCAGTKMFIYDPGVLYTGQTPVVADSTTWGLYEFTNPNTANCTLLGLTDADLVGGVQLLGKKMRLTNIVVDQSNPSTNTWQVALSVVYGDSDLLCNTELSTGTGTQGACDAASPNYAIGVNVAAADSTDSVLCKIQSGSQFCSTATVSTIVQQRITN